MRVIKGHARSVLRPIDLPAQVDAESSRPIYHTSCLSRPGCCNFCRHHKQRGYLEKGSWGLYRGSMRVIQG